MLEFRLATEVTPNFDQGLIAYRERTVAVVRAHDSAVLAVAEPRIVGDGAVDCGPLIFVDAPELVAALAVSQPVFQVLTPADLDGPFDAAVWPHVSPYDIKYWRPGTLGEALFNYWD